jgi:hypothetical protein
VSNARPHVPEEELHAFCDGELSPAQRAEIAEHLLGCLICRSQHAEVEVTRSRVSSLLAIASPRHIGAPPRTASRRTVVRRQAPRMMAAAAVAAIGIGVWFSVRAGDASRGPTEFASVLGLSSFFRVGHATGDAAAIRGRQLTIADRALPQAEVHAGPATTALTTPATIGKATEVDPVVASEWSIVSVDQALEADSGRLPHISGIPVKLVRIHPSAIGGRPTLLVRQEMLDGHALWVLEGLERDIAPIDQLLQASGIAMSMATRTRPDYVNLGTETAVTVRMVRVVGYLPADSLNALAQKIVLH